MTVREETASCNKFRCAQWDSWNSWSECSSPCHSKGSPAGRQTRERSCHTDESVCSISKNGYIPTTEQTPYSAITEDYYTIVPISGIATGYYSTLPTTTNVFYPNSPEFLDRMFGGTNAISVKVAKKAKRQVNPACACTGESTANQPCNDFICPYWSSWSSWSQCSQSCKALGGTAGTRIKSRSCVTDTTRCSTTTSHATTNIDVNVDVNVTVNGNHNSGKRTSVQKSLHTNDPNAHLSVATENSQSRRNRQAYVDSICSCDESSEGGSKVSEVCNDFFCPHYGDWQEWTSCSASCGRGTRNRSQTCIVDTNYCGRDKLANDQVCRCSPEVPPGQSDVCNSFSCPIWSDWSSWSSCTISCTQPNGAPGSHTKTRSCRTDPALQCRAGTEGNNSPTVNTNVDVNVNVNVNSDNSKNLKDRTASKNQPNSDEVEIPKQLQQDANTRSSQILSSRSRLRQIAQLEAIRRSKRQANDPCLCPGSDSITETCNAFNCPSFSDWGSWSSCSVSCGSGSRSQSRNCILDSNYCKTVTTATTTTTTDPICKCTGLTSQSETCVSEACPTYSEWSSWGVCSVTCGSNGQITRNRVCSRSDVPCAGNRI